MIGSLRDHWLYTGPDIWNKLASVRKLPLTFSPKLYRTAYDLLQSRPEYKELEKAVNDPTQPSQGWHTAVAFLRFALLEFSKMKGWLRS